MISAKLHGKGGSLEVGRHRMTITYSDQTYVTLLFGPKETTMGLLLDKKLCHERDPLRAGLGADMEGLFESNHISVHENIESLQHTYKERYGSNVVQPSKLFWLATMYQAWENGTPNNVQRLMPDCMKIAWSWFPQPLRNPALPEEDLYTTVETKQLVEVMSPTGYSVTYTPEEISILKRMNPGGLVGAAAEAEAEEQRLRNPGLLRGWKSKFMSTFDTTT